MAEYTVKPNQNIFDVALHLYGSVEGIFDLLITNQDLNMNSDLVPGMSLEYHEDFVINSLVVNSLKDKNTIPANGLRSVYFKRPEHPYVMGAIFGDKPRSQMSEFIAAGEGELLVDWGDNSDIENIHLGLLPQRYIHYYNNEVDERRIKFYGKACEDSSCNEYHTSGHLQCMFTHLDVSGLGETMAITRPLIVDKFINQSNERNLAGLFLVEGTYHVDLQGCFIESLLPLVNMENLQEVHLENAIFPSVSVLDDYLEALATEPSSTGQRIGCKVYMTTEPTEVGYLAIQTILGEKEWNTPVPWQFYINGQQYIIPT